MEISKIKEVLARPVFYTAEKILGLDIGSRFIKVVQVKKTTVGYSVKKVGLKELPLDVIVDGEVMDDTTLVDLIRSFIKEFQAEDTQDKDVALITSGRDVLIKSVETEFKEREIERKKKDIATANIPYDIEDVCYDTMTLKGKPNRVVIAAAKKDRIYSILGIIQDVDLKPVIISMVPIVLAKLFRINGLIPDKGDYLIVSLCSDRTNIISIRDGVFNNYLDARTGVDVYLKSIAKEQQIPVDEAVPIILGEGAITERVAKTLNYNNRSIVQQVKAFIKADDLKCEEIILTGEGATIPGLSESIQNATEVVCKIGDPFVGMSTETTIELPNRYDIAFGLAILGLRNEGVNLLPVEMRPKKEQKLVSLLKGSFPLWAGGLTFLVLALIYILTAMSVGNFRNQMKSLRVQETTVMERMALLDDLKKKRQEIRKRIQIVEQLEEGKYSRVKLLDELNRILPPYTWLTYLSEGGGERSFAVLIKGITGSNLGTSEFLKRLEDSPHFSGVELSFTKTSESSGVEITEFEIRTIFSE